MKDAVNKLKFAEAYLEWKRAREWVAQQWTPEEYLEEVILKEKAEVYDKIYDLISSDEDYDDADLLDQITSLVMNE